jgi:PAS domain S-box-containing protein
MHHPLLDNLCSAVLMLDADGIITYCNRTTQNITGYDEAELLGKPFHFLSSDPSDSIKTLYNLTIAARQGQIGLAELRQKKNGDEYWAEITLSGIHDASGNLTGFTCLITDITERKQNEIRLRETEEMYRLLVEGMQDYSIFMLDPTGHILTWNEGGQQLIGYLSGEIVGKHFSIFHTSDDLTANKPEKELQIARAVGKYHEEGWRVKKNGSPFWASVVLTALYNENNTLIGFSKITKDLSERKKEEALLRQSEERYRLLVEQVTDYAIFMMDEKGRIVSWNEGANKIKGYTAKEIIGKYFSIFYPQEDIINGKPANELRIARSVGKYEEEGWRLRKDGSRFWANVVITAVYNQEGVLVGFSKVTRDLTERKRAEQTARENASKYQAIARKMEVINQELSKANQELEQFTSIVSHDLQEPLRTVKSFLHLMDIKIDQGQTTELKQYVTKSILGSNRMKELIENLMNYAQVSKSQWKADDLSFRELLEQAFQNLRAAIDVSGTSIVIENESDVIVKGDRVQLVQLIQNLLSNAMKFTVREQPGIRIGWQQENGYVRFSFTDNGIGMQPDEVSKVFEVFKRLHSARTFPGTGMGLAICKKVIERHHGKIWVESEPGIGSTFHFTLWEETSKQLVG